MPKSGLKVARGMCVIPNTAPFPQGRTKAFICVNLSLCSPSRRTSPFSAAPAANDVISTSKAAKPHASSIPKVILLLNCIILLFQIAPLMKRPMIWMRLKLKVIIVSGIIAINNIIKNINIKSYMILASSATLYNVPWAIIVQFNVLLASMRASRM
jgi:hypothetical protein